MIISHTHKLIFFSNPKTGSESIRMKLEAINEETIEFLACLRTICRRHQEMQSTLHLSRVLHYFVAQIHHYFFV